MRPALPALALLLGAALSVPAAAQAPAEFDPSDFGKILIQPRQATGTFVLEQAFGDYQNEPIITYGADSPAVRLGRPVGRLDLLFEDGRTGFCTAFVVDDRHVLTNHHCVPGMRGDPTGLDSGLRAAQLVMGFIRPGRTDGVDRYEISPEIVETSRELDYSVLRVFGDPSARYGRLRLAAADPENSEFLWIIGHPQGQAQHISREGCAAASPAISGEGKLIHTCDTLGGNSGSPVIRLSDQRVIGLHHAGDSRTGYNMAIPMTRILRSSKVLRADPSGRADQDDRRVNTISFPTRSRRWPVVPVSETGSERRSEALGMEIIEQVGPSALFYTVEEDARDTTVMYAKDGEDWVVRSGEDAAAGTSYYWLTLRKGAEAAVIRVNAPVPAARLTREQKDLMTLIACSVDFQGTRLGCYR